MTEPRPAGRGRSLELFFVDGAPDGILTAEVFGWTGHVLRIPRLRLADGLRRPEAAQTGADILLGEIDDRPCAYIGEAESVVARIRDHAAKKDWWREAIVLTTAADNLHKAHVRYIEARLVQMARAAGNVDLDNGTDPALPSLTEAQRANMEEFLDMVAMVLPALGIGLFQSGRRALMPERAPEQMLGPVFCLSTPKHGVEAKARLEESGMVVLKGALGRRAWESQKWQNTTYGQLHARLIRESILRQNETHAIVSQDYSFNSPSAASAVLNGRPSKGRLDWRKEATGRTLADWEADQLKDIPI